MNVNKISTGEHEPGRWETFTGSEQDLSDMLQLMNEQFGTKVRSYIRPPKHGMILRRGNVPAGYITGDVKERLDKTRVLFIADIYVKKQYRSPGTIIKLVRAIREYGTGVKATYVGWIALEEKLHRMYEKVTPPRPFWDEDGGGYMLPLEKLDARMLARLSQRLPGGRTIIPK